VLDVGELSTKMRPRATDDAGSTAYLMHDPPLSLLSEGNVSTVRFERSADGQPQVLLTIPRNQTGPERVYVFAPLTPDGTPSS
jgi:hypothetical protein